MALTTIDDRGLKTPIDLLDNEKIRFGTGNDLEIFHDGNNSYIHDTGTGSLFIKGSIFYVNSPSAEDMISATANGAVKLYYDNSKKFETTSTGISTQGNCIITGHFYGPDNSELRLGSADDLKLWHQTGNSYITSTGANLTLRALDHIYLQDIDGNTMADFNDGGAVELYHNGTKKLETSAGGVSITGELAVTSDVHFNSATNAAKDVYWDESASELQFSDNVYATFGTGEDLKIYHDGSNSYIKDAGTGQLDISSDKVWISGSNNESMADFTENGAVQLYYDNSKKFETITEGTKITGQLGINMTPDTAASSSYVLQLSSGHSQCCLSLGNTSSGTGPNNGLILSNDGSHAYLYNRENTSLLFGVNDLTKFKMETDGSFEIVDGDLTVANGHGINFGATGQAAGATSELLADYEEGTFTAAITVSSGTNPSQDAYAHRYAYYRKIGKLVHFRVDVQFGAISQTASGSAVVSGLPFANSSSTYAYGMAFSAGYNNIWGTNNFPTQAYVNPGSSEFYLMNNSISGGTNYVDASNIANGTRLICGGTYMTDS